MIDPPTRHPDDRTLLMAAAGLLDNAGTVLQAAGQTLRPDIRERAAQLGVDVADQQALFTVQMLDRATSNFGGMDRERLLRAVCGGSRPGNNPDANLLAQAIAIVTGPLERTATTSPGLVPVLANLTWPDPPDGDAAGRRIPTQAIRFDEAAFLPTAVPKADEYARQCRELVGLLVEGLNQDFDSPEACLAGLLGLTERLFHAIPAAPGSDVSLFDHSRVVAACASCLAVSHAAQGDGETAGEPRFRLVSIALGSIQRFITRDVPASSLAPGETIEKGMARRLRARSFYVGLLSGLVARRILDAVGLPTVNRLIDAGGRSLLLLPETPQVLEQVDQTVTYVRQWMMDHLGGAIRLDLANSPSLSQRDLQAAALPSTLRDLDGRLAAARLDFPFPNLRMTEGWADDGWIADDITLPVDREEFNDTLEKIGRHLPETVFISVDTADSEHLPPVFNVVGYTVRLHRTRPRTSGRHVAISLRNETDLTAPLQITATYLPRATEEAIQRLRQANEEQPLPGATARPGDLLTFQDLAWLATDADGQPLPHAMLGTLKADVDRLGMLLGYGLGKQVSFGRFATMARSLDLFFKGFLNERLATQFPHIYTVFAGGDDLFLIGPWYDLVRLLEDLDGTFRRHTCGNRNITFSAGLVFSSPTAPVRHLAGMAEEALEAAKELGRDRVSIGSVTHRWDDFRRAMQLHRLILQLARVQKSDGRSLIPPAMVYRSLQYAKMATRSLSPGGPASPADFKWRAQLNYDLKRNLPLDDKSPRTLEQLHRQLMTLRPLAEDAAVLQTAASLTLYCLRGTPQ